MDTIVVLSITGSRYLEDVLGAKNPKTRTFSNKIPEEVKEHVVCEALKQTELSPRELARLITVLHLKIKRISASEEP
jgi:hypothetical protein